MGIKNLIKKRDNNFSNIASDTAVDIIKKLSGAEIKQTKKVIDNLIVIGSASGGAGASTIISNIAHTLKSNDFNVIVIDLNILYPIQHTMLGVKKKLDQSDLISYLIGKSSLGESIDNSGEVSLLYANNRNLIDYLNVDDDIAMKNFEIAINSLRRLFDLIIVDTPLNIEHSIINEVFYLSDFIYLVWDESISSIINTERFRKNLNISGINSNIKVILNKRTDIHYTKYPFDKLGLELVEVLPFTREVIECGLNSSIFCHKGASKSKNAIEFYNGIQSLANNILKNGGYIGK